jgi:hypothetical protein
VGVCPSHLIEERIRKCARARLPHPSPNRCQRQAIAR